MHLFKHPVLLFALLVGNAASWAAEAPALTPNDILLRIENAQASIKALPDTQHPQWTLWAAVSFSVPEANLLRLASDAGAAGIPLVFRGVGTEPNANDRQRQEQTQTALQRYGKGFLARHLADFEPLVKAGVTVKLDPKRFEKASVSDVPRLILMRETQTPSQETLYFTARGDVTLRYALDFLVDEIENAPVSVLTEDDRIEALTVLQSALTQLGERP